MSIQETTSNPSSPLPPGATSFHEVSAAQSPVVASSPQKEEPSTREITVITADSLEITPEATQAAKKWNDHIKATRGHGSDAAKGLNSTINSMFTAL